LVVTILLYGSRFPVLGSPAEMRPILFLAIAAALPLTALAQRAELTRIGGYDTTLGAGGAEIIAFDPSTRRAYLANGVNSTFDIIDFANPAAPTLIRRVDVAAQGGAPNSVAVRNGLVAVAVEGAPQTNGRIVFYSGNGDLLASAAAGPLPDMVAISPNGRWALSANEGEPNAAYTIDPEGSITIVDLQNGPVGAPTRTIGFTDFNAGGPRAAELPAGVRVFGPNATVARSFEPEYIVISGDSSTAWVAIQEANALAVIDIAAARVTRIFALGSKDHSLPGNGIDASDRDGAANGPTINIRSWPVRGYYMPDAIALAEINGRPLVLTANEGDARDYAGFSEEVRIGALNLDPAAFPNATELKLNANLGRLTATRAQGDTDGDGDFDQLFVFGARSFSIFDGSNGALVYDSKDEFERFTAAAFPTLFNGEGTTASFDSRSDNKGPEPEGVVTANLGGRQWGFISNERFGGIFVYDLTQPAGTFRVGFGPSMAPDRSPEGLAYVAPENSASNRPLLLMANEVSGTLGVYQLNACTVSAISVAVSAVQITGYCPDGLDVLRRRAGVVSVVRSGLAVNGTVVLAIDSVINDEYFTALPSDISAINGLSGALRPMMVSTLSPFGLALLAGLLALVGLRLRARG